MSAWVNLYVICLITFDKIVVLGHFNNIFKTQKKNVQENNY